MSSMRRCHALGRGCQDRESCTAADGEARPCPASTSCHTSDPARSAELAVHWSPTAPRLAGARRPWSSVKSSTSWTLFTPARELNGALAEADLSLEDFKEAHRSVLLGARSSAEGSSRSDRARWRPKFASRHLHRHSWLGVPCSQHVAFASSIVLGTWHPQAVGGGRIKEWLRKGRDIVLRGHARSAVARLVRARLGKPSTTPWSEAEL